MMCLDSELRDQQTAGSMMWLDLLVREASRQWCVADQRDRGASGDP